MDRDREKPWPSCTTPGFDLLLLQGLAPGHLPVPRSRCRRQRRCGFQSVTRVVRLPGPKGSSWLGVGPRHDFALGLSQALRRYSWHSSGPLIWASLCPCGGSHMPSQHSLTTYFSLLLERVFCRSLGWGLLGAWLTLSGPELGSCGLS